ncbi:hypothetical protein C6P42_001508 [Pichia californica]|nr:hypothetical protein C6P42_001508 [[Candida] californica]
MISSIDENSIATQVTEKILQAYVSPHKYLKGFLSDKQLDHFSKARAKQSEFNVLAGLVYWHGNDLSTMKLVSLTTGVKCVPDEILKNSNGKILHDMHAEILAIRGLNWYILKEIEKLKNGNYYSDIIEMINEENVDFKFKLKRNIKFSLYISELPCGDCSLDEMVQNDSDIIDNNNKRIKLSTNNTNNTTNNSLKLRSGELYDQVGVVRTKPGRKDSPFCSSVSCSDKLLLISLIGIFKGIISDLIELEFIGLDYLILPQDKFERNKVAITRCFDKRLNLKNIDLCQLIRVLKAPNSISCNYYELLKDKKLGILEIDRKKIKRANELSIICIPEFNQLEIVNKGVKNGHNFKSVIKTTNGISILSKYSMMMKRIQLEPQLILNYHIENYYKGKLPNNCYFEERSKFKSILGEWPQDIADYVDIHTNKKSTK